MRPALSGETPAARDDARYEIVGEIATGGVGVVFHGRDKSLGRDVALKVLRTDHARKPDVITRFLEEAQIGGQLQHPGIVPVYTPGLQADGRPYFTMKLIRGRTLATLLSGRAETPRLLRIFERVCGTMAYAHARRVIHRDLKPSNVMVGSFGEVHVVDWGFGKVLGRAPRSPERTEGTTVATVRSSAGFDSISGSVMGTPAYMPPEQALGRVEDLDARADVFSLGAILCEILTGAPPYTGPKRDVLEQAAEARLDDAMERLDGCGADAALVDLCRRALAPASEDRPDDAAVVAAELQAYFAAAEERARKAEVEAVNERARLERGRADAAWARRAKRRTLLALASVLAAVLAGGGAWFRYERARVARAEAARPRVEVALERSAGHAAREEWDAARMEARKAEVLAASAGLPTVRVDRALRHAARGRAAALRRRDHAAERKRFVRALEEARLGAGRYEDLLGFDRLPPRLDSPEVRRAAGAALEDWARRSPASRRAELLASAARLDPDEFRARLRRADIATLRATATAVDAAATTPRSLDALALLLPAGDPARVSLLRRARRAHPGDFWLNLELGRSLDGARAVPYLQAAVALRPDWPPLREELAKAEEGR